MSLVDDPDESIECRPAACCGCGADLAGVPVTAQADPTAGRLFQLGREHGEPSQGQPEQSLLAEQALRYRRQHPRGHQRRGLAALRIHDDDIEPGHRRPPGDRAPDDTTARDDNVRGHGHVHSLRRYDPDQVRRSEAASLPLSPLPGAPVVGTCRPAQSTPAGHVRSRRWLDGAVTNQPQPSASRHPAGAATAQPAGAATGQLAGAAAPDDLRARLADARLYLCTDARRSTGDLAPFLGAVLSAGVDIVQLREKGLEAREELNLLEMFADACRRHGRLLAVNDRADVALAARSDVLHLGQDDLPVPAARRILGPRPLIGRSSHSPAQADAAASIGG